MIEVHNLSFEYPDGDKILLDLSFRVNESEFVSILGKSGCGKTTLVRILSSFLEGYEGNILFENREIKKPSRKRIIVNQENDLFDWLTVMGNMKLVTNDLKEIEKFLKLVGLNEYRDYYANKLSGGMRKRLSLARALSVNPDFLLLDEPFGSLDYSTHNALIMELDKIFALTKKATLLVTHNIEEAIFLSDRVLLLGGHPTSIKKEIKIRFKHPRNERLKNSKEFLNYMKLIRQSYV
jgi:NitT/TauT family transport system ATP-binding protein